MYTSLGLTVMLSYTLHNKALKNKFQSLFLVLGALVQLGVNF